MPSTPASGTHTSSSSSWPVTQRPVRHEQAAQQLILATGEHDGLAGHGQFARSQVVAPARRAWMRLVAVRHAADQHAQPGGDHGDAGRLGEEVVGAGVEQVDLVVLPDFAVSTRIGVVSPSERSCAHRQELFDDVWGVDAGVDPTNLDIYLRRLRDKLAPVEVTNVRGLGYRIVAAMTNPLRRRPRPGDVHRARGVGGAVLRARHHRLRRSGRRRPRRHPRADRRRARPVGGRTSAPAAAW